MWTNTRIIHFLHFHHPWMLSSFLKSVLSGNVKKMASNFYFIFISLITNKIRLFMICRFLFICLFVFCSHPWEWGFIPESDGTVDGKKVMLLQLEFKMIDSMWSYDGLYSDIPLVHAINRSLLSPSSDTHSGTGNGIVTKRNLVPILGELTFWYIYN